MEFNCLRELFVLVLVGIGSPLTLQISHMLKKIYAQNIADFTYACRFQGRQLWNCKTEVNNNRQVKRRRFLATISAQISSITCSVAFPNFFFSNTGGFLVMSFSLE